MLHQLIPLFILAGILGLYGLSHIVRHCWNWLLYERVAEGLDITDVIHTITPTDTPFMRLLSKENSERNDLNND